jgi:hypothetical protein
MYITMSNEEATAIVQRINGDSNRGSVRFRIKSPPAVRIGAEQLTIDELQAILVKLRDYSEGAIAHTALPPTVERCYCGSNYCTGYKRVDPPTRLFERPDDDVRHARQDEPPLAPQNGA